MPKTLTAAAIAAAVVLGAIFGVHQASAQEPTEARDYGSWQYGENGWGAYWYDLWPKSFQMWEGDPWTRAEIRDLEPARLRLTCPGRYSPYIQLVSLGVVGLYETDRDLEYKFGTDVTQEQWRGGRVGYFKARVTYQGNRWEIIDRWADGSGDLAIRWHDDLGWVEAVFPNTDGLRQASAVLDDKCGFLDDEPPRVGPPIVAGEPYASSCLGRRDRYIAQMDGRPNAGDVKSAAYVTHSAIPDNYRACRLTFTHPHIYRDSYICWINRPPYPDRVGPWNWAAGYWDLTDCLAELAEWEENGYQGEP